MEILIQLNKRETLRLEGTFKLTDLDRDNIKKHLPIDNVKNVELVNIGTSADWLVLKIVFDFIALGAGINGTIELGKKIQKLFKRKKIVSIDKEVAEAIAISLIAQKEEIKTLEKINEYTINLADLSEFLPENNGLSKKPHNYYTMTYRVNENKVYILGVKSVGKAEILKRFAVGFHGMMEEMKKK